jgi:predicted NUDIX family NTP pyrophosphohydrolase
MATGSSAGIVVYRRADTDIEVLLGHMGGPFWARKDAGAWTIPKGEPELGEDLVGAARREFAEELGLPVPDGPLLELGEVSQRGGKVVTAWAVEGDLEPASIVPGTFEMVWPPRSGVTRTFPELDRVAWFGLEAAHEHILAGQRPLLDRLHEQVARHRPPHQR